MAMFCFQHVLPITLFSWFLVLLPSCLSFLVAFWGSSLAGPAYPQWSGLSPSWVQVSLCYWGVSLGDCGHSHLFLSVLNAIYWEFRWFLNLYLYPSLSDLQAGLPACPPEVSFLLLFSLLSPWSFSSQPEWQLLRSFLATSVAFGHVDWAQLLAHGAELWGPVSYPLLAQAGSRGCTRLGLFVWAGLVLGLDWVRPPESQSVHL